MKYKQEFERMLSGFYEYKDYINLSLKFMEENSDTDVARRVWATLMSINRKNLLKKWGYKYNSGWAGWKKIPFEEDSQSLREDCSGWIDHPAILYNKKTKERILISEPYGIGLNQLKKLIKFCEEKDYTCNIGGVVYQSIHFPNSTIQIALRKSKKNEPL